MGHEPTPAMSQKDCKRRRRVFSSNSRCLPSAMLFLYLPTCYNLLYTYAFKHKLSLGDKHIDRRSWGYREHPYDQIWKRQRLQSYPRYDSTLTTKTIPISFPSRKRGTDLYSATATGVTRRTKSSSSLTGSSVSSNLISCLAECALKLRLHKQSSVACDIRADPRVDLFQRILRVGPVTVKGKGWGSQLGLTCRAIEATVQTCALDLGKVIRDRKLRLTTPATGDCMVALDESDFGNFITHPLVKLPLVRLREKGSEPFAFLNENVRFDTVRKEVTFYGIVGGEKWKCSLRRNMDGGGAIVNVYSKALREEEKNGNEEQLKIQEKLLGEAVTQYFNELILDLDGTYLSFRDLMMTSVTSKEYGNSVLMLALNIDVHKFPSAGMAF